VDVCASRKKKKKKKPVFWGFVCHLPPRNSNQHIPQLDFQLALQHQQIRQNFL
jgi:hypothetical protein